MRNPSRVADAVEQELATAALRKRAAGKRPTGQELAALRKVERRKDEEDFWRHVENVPKKHYLEMAGQPGRPRAAKVILEQAEHHGLPLAGRTVNLRLVISAFHDFLAANAAKLARETAPDAGETKAEAERREKIAQANLREIKAREAAGELVPAEAVTRLFVQHVNEAKAIFEQVPDRVLAELPQRLKAGVRKRVQRDVRKIVDDTCEALADLLADSRLPEESAKATPRQVAKARKK